MANDAPYLSVVVTARNDNHGGNLLGRMQLFVNGLLEQCRRHHLPTELILVEWNPPTERPRLAEALSWPTEASPCAVRIIEVPPEIHNRYKHAKALPLYQMIAKNVGIRRARGAFVLATNIDLLFNDQLMAFLAARKLRPDRMYRTDRHDVPADVPPHAPLDQQLEFCRQHRIRTHTRKGTAIFRDSREIHLTQGAFKELAGAWATAPRKKVLKALVTWPVFLPVHFVSRAFAALHRHFRLHTNACGDFTLLARDAWFRLRGYAELDVFSMHLDYLCVHAAHHAGYREEVLGEPMRVYHIEHGSGWTPEGEAALNTRLAAAGIEQVTGPQLRTWTKQIRRNRAPLINTEDWGLFRDSLAESVISDGAPRPCPV